MIKITDDFVIDVDNYNYIPMIDKHKLDKQGKPTYKQLGFYSSIENAILKIIDTMNKEQFINCDMDLIDAVSVIKENNKKFKEYLDKALGE